MPVLTMHVAVLLYPGGVSFEYALAAETLTGCGTLSCCTLDREPFGASVPTRALGPGGQFLGGDECLRGVDDGGEKTMAADTPSEENPGSRLRIDLAVENDAHAVGWAGDSSLP